MAGARVPLKERVPLAREKNKFFYANKEKTESKRLK